MKPQVIILTEGSHKYGLGHVARMRALTEAFEEKNFKVHLFVDGDKSVDSILKGTDYTLFLWKDSFPELENTIRDKIVIIDSYTAGEEIYKQVSNLAGIKLYFDDFIRLNYPSGVVVNPTLGAEELKYPKSKDITYLLGPKYLPLRKPFWKEPQKTFGKGINRILVQFGGDDIKGASPTVTEFLARNYPSVEINVVVGKAFKNSTVERLKALKEKFSNVNLYYAPSGEEIARLMTEADIGVVAAGLMTVYEALSRGLPLITVITMENQVDVLNRLISKNLVFNAGWFNDENLFKNIVRYINLLTPPEERKRFFLLGRSVVDGKGAPRLVQFVENLLKNQK